MNTCPLCGRAPSERIGVDSEAAHDQGISGVCFPATDRCDGPLHTLADRCGEMGDALHLIANHPHNSYDANKGDSYGIGVTDGHRCAAEIARTLLSTLEHGK